MPCLTEVSALVQGGAPRYFRARKRQDVCWLPSAGTRQRLFCLWGKKRNLLSSLLLQKALRHKYATDLAFLFYGSVSSGSSLALFCIARRPTTFTSELQLSAVKLVASTQLASYASARFLAQFGQSGLCTLAPGHSTDRQQLRICKQ